MIDNSTRWLMRITIAAIVGLYFARLALDQRIPGTLALVLVVISLVYTTRRYRQSSAQDTQGEATGYWSQQFYGLLLLFLVMSAINLASGLRQMLS